MKKLLVSLAVVTALCATLVCAHRQSILSEDALLANIEALADDESTTGSVCYHSITSAEGMQIFYCAECRWVNGKKIFMSGKGICP